MNVDYIFKSKKIEGVPILLFNTLLRCFTTIQSGRPKLPKCLILIISIRVPDQVRLLVHQKQLTLSGCSYEET